MSEWIKNERLPLTIIVTAFAVLMLASVVSGCQVDDWVKVKVPNDVATAIDSSDTITVADSEFAWEEWTAFVERNSEKFAAEIEDGREVVEIVRTLTETGLGLATEASAALPGGALISTGLALLGGLFLRRPGDAKREQREKEDSYNAGLAKGRDLLSQTVSASLLKHREAAD